MHPCTFGTNLQSNSHSNQLNPSPTQPSTQPSTVHQSVTCHAHHFGRLPSRMGNTPGPDSSPDDEAGLARKRPRSPDPETEPGHVPKKQRHTSSISSMTAKPVRSSKKRAHSPDGDDSLGAGGDGGDIARKRRRPKQEAEKTSSQSRRSAAQFLPTPPPPPPAALLGQEHSRSVAHIQRIRSGLQDIERRLARLAQLCESDRESP